MAASATETGVNCLTSCCFKNILRCNFFPVFQVVTHQLMSGGNVIHVTNDNKWVLLLFFHSFFTTWGVKLSLPRLLQESMRWDTSFLPTWCVIFNPTQDQLRAFDGALPHVCPDPGTDGSLYTGLQVHRATWLVTDVFRSRASETHLWRQCRHGSQRLEVKLTGQV